MMTGSITIDKNSIKSTQDIIEQFVAATGKGAEEAIEIMAFSAGRRLINTVQPYGLKGGKKFEENIARQINQVFIATNLGQYGEQRDIRAAHNTRRRNGRVSPAGKITKVKGEKWKGVISESEKDRYVRDQQEKAGQAKGAWVEAINSIGKSNISGIPAWIKRHASSGFGKSRKEGEGLKTKITIINETPYMTTRMQKPQDLMKAAQDGFANGMRRLSQLAAKAEEKANKALQ